MVRAFRLAKTDHGAVGLSQNARSGRGIIDQQRSAAGEFRIKFLRLLLAIRGRRLLPFAKLFQRTVVEPIKKLRIHFPDARNHFAYDCPRLRGRIGCRLHAPEPVQDYSGERVHHGRGRGYGQDVSGHFDGALFRLPLDFFDPARVRHRADIPNLREDAPRVILQQRCQLMIGAPGADDGAFEEFFFGHAE